MAETMAIELGDGTTVQAEIIGELGFGQQAEQQPAFGDVGLGSGARRAAGEIGSAVALTLDQVRETVQGVGRWAAETIAQSAVAGAPDAFEVEFGLKLAVKSGHLVGVIAEAGSEASLKVRLSWDLAARRERAASAGVPATAVSTPAAAE
ncbi:CU044_2847 family protein [Kitasatospora sp. LaBMicrA B282]|uniref:CU044_2847 family protein n=1 Tax=Kitasatospora sp. LaBMicrA B282 TaxID=3420949 RepID=UPI003D0F39F9